MFRKMAHVLLIVAVLAATGSHWLVFQTIAWSTMLADRMPTESLVSALENTFDGHHPCALCKKISRDRQSEKKAEFNVQFKKAELTFNQITIVLSPPAHFVTIDSSSPSYTALTRQPAVPPPRTLAS